jgi:HprK-related kinase A
VTVGELSARELGSRLNAGRLRLQVGPFLVAIRSSIASVRERIAQLYCHHDVETAGAGGHFSIQLDPPSLVRRLVRRQVTFESDGRRPFLPLPIEMAPLLLEGGLNWCIGTQAHHLVVLHAATLERHGVGLVMPAQPGSGKSTLCAALMTRGWRLLSDEFALIDPVTGELIPVPRPVALKDASVPLIKAWAPEAYFSGQMLNNEGEHVAYLRPDPESVAATGHRCLPRLVVIPRYVRDAPPTVTMLTRARTVVHLADNSFNYNLHGLAGFERLTVIADRGPAAILRYSRLDDGVKVVSELAEAAR